MATMPPGRVITQAATQVGWPPAPQPWTNGSSPAVLLLTEYLPRIKGSRFHKLLLTFLAASAGLTPVYDAANYGPFLHGTGGSFPGRYTDTVHADLGTVVADVRGGSLPQVEAEIALCCMLANAAYESVALHDKHAKWQAPEIQFFRHVRHAASHGNRWHFASPKLPLKLDAAWRGLSLYPPAHHGNQCFKGSLDSADLLRLLLDVEDLLNSRSAL
jgi:hypothetical protein